METTNHIRTRVATHTGFANSTATTVLIAIQKIAAQFFGYRRQPKTSDYPREVVDSVFDFLPNTEVRAVACTKRELADRMLRWREVATTTGKHPYRHMYQIINAADNEEQALQIYRRSRNLSNLPDSIRNHQDFEANLRLTAAARFGDLDRIDQLLNTPAITTLGITSALAWAVQKNDLEITNRLLSDQRHDPLIDEIRGDERLEEPRMLRAVLCLAAANGARDATSQLLKETDHPYTYFKALQLATSHGRLNAVKLLLGHTQLSMRQVINLISIAHNHHHEQIENLLVSRWDRIVWRNRVIGVGTGIVVVGGLVAIVPLSSALLNAASARNSLILSKLSLKLPFIIPWDIRSALKIAAKKGHIKIAKLLLSDPRLNKWDPASAFLIATKNRHTDMTKLLNNHQGLGGWHIESALKVAAKNGHIDMVRLLLNDKRLEGLPIKRAFKLAVENGHTEIVKLLLNDRRLKEWYIESALKIAAKKGYIDMVKLLLKDKTFEGDYIESPLKAAITNGHVEIAKHLLSDERYSVRNWGHLLFLAAHNKNPEVMRMLRNHPRFDPKFAAFPVQLNSEDAYVQAVKLFLTGNEHEKISAFALYTAYRKGYGRAIHLLRNHIRGEHALGRALHYAAKKGTLSTLKHMLNLHQFGDETMKHLFLTATDGGQLDIIKHLLNTRDIQLPALQEAYKIATSKQYTEIPKLLRGLIIEHTHKHLR